MALSFLIPLFWLALAVLGITVIRRSSVNHKKRWTICVVVLVLLLWELSGLLVYVIPFSSPEAAYQSIHPQFTQSEHDPLILEGKTSALIIDGDASEQSHQFMIRKNNEWKLSGLFAPSFPYTIHDNGISIYLYNWRSSQDHYLCVLLSPFETECNIEPSDAAVFYEYPAPDVDTDALRYRSFYAYIGPLEEDYELAVNGVTFCIPKASALGDPEPVWPYFLSMACALALLIAGSIGIIRIRTISRARKAVMIFGLLLLSMFLGTVLLTLFI